MRVTIATAVSSRVTASIPAVSRRRSTPAKNQSGSNACSTPMPQANASRAGSARKRGTSTSAISAISVIAPDSRSLAPRTAATVSAIRSGSSRRRAISRVADRRNPYSPIIVSRNANDCANSTSPSSVAPSARASHGSVTSGSTVSRNCAAYMAVAFWIMVLRIAAPRRARTASVGSAVDRRPFEGEARRQVGQRLAHRALLGPEGEVAGEHVVQHDPHPRARDALLAEVLLVVSEAAAGHDQEAADLLPEAALQQDRPDREAMRDGGIGEGGGADAAGDPVEGERPLPQPPRRGAVAVRPHAVAGLAKLAEAGRVGLLEPQALEEGAVRVAVDVQQRSAEARPEAAFV